MTIRYGGGFFFCRQSVGIEISESPLYQWKALFQNMPTHCINRRSVGIGFVASIQLISGGESYQFKRTFSPMFSAYTAY